MRILILGAAVLLTAGLAADLALVQPNEVSAQLAAKGPHPAIFQVGPNVLYRGKHIPGSVYAGPASRPEGLELLRNTVDKLPRNSEIVVYCGCCPWGNCPNIKPAIALLKDMGLPTPRPCISRPASRRTGRRRGTPWKPARPGNRGTCKIPLSRRKAPLPRGRDSVRATVSTRE